MQVESTSKPMLTVDEVEQIQRKKVATIIGHVFQLTYAAFFDKLVQEEKVNRCHGCAIQHPSRRQHSCLMFDAEDAWCYYHDEAREQIDLAVVMKTVESVCSNPGLKLGQTWEIYLTELPKLPWTSLYLTSLVATIIGHVFQLTYAAFFDKLVQEEKVNRCHGCAIQHPSQRQHSCLMFDTEDAWCYYHDEAREQIDLAVVMKTVESVCSNLGLKLGQTWESYMTELPKLPWTSLC